MRILGMACLAAACACAAAQGETVVTGAKFNAFISSPESFLEQPVVIEDTYEGIVSSFTRTETQNYFTPDMYVKFKLGQCPYPCIGQRTELLQKGLDACSPGDLVRVTGDLQQIWQSRTLYTTQGQYTGGRSWEERVMLAGPLPSEYFFSVGKIEKGWGRQDTAGDMFSEGKNLKSEAYREIPLAALNVDPGSLVEKCIYFEGEFAGIDESRSDIERAAGMLPAEVIKFRVKNEAMANFVSMSGANLEGFRALPAGGKIQVYGRIRVADTPKGTFVGIIADRVMKVVPRQAPAPTADAGASIAPPPPPPGPGAL